MPLINRIATWMLGCLLLTATLPASAQDWPQWRGPNRDAKASGFTAPATWPKALNQKWKITVGEGIATPALVGDKLYVFSRSGGNEVTRCLDAQTGKELWQDKYPALGVDGPASGFSGPRCSPAVADGKVVTLGVHGTLSCLDAATGTKLWRKDEFQGETPRFATASSPIIVAGLCIAQLGGQGNGAIAAYDLASGADKWKWTGDSPAYASPALMTLGNTTLIIAETERNIVALNSSDGKQVWQTPFAAQGMGAYNAASPVEEGQTLIYSGGGRGTRAVKIENEGDKYAAKELWSNPDKAVQFNSPVLKDGLLYGLSQSNELFCLDAQTGQTKWTASIGQTGGGRGMGGPPGGGPGGAGAPPGGAGGPPSGGPADGRRPGGPGGRGRGGRGGGRGGFGSIVDAGPVLLALTPSSELIVFTPDGMQFTEQAKIKVADTPTYAYPVLSGNRIFIKDQESVILWTID